MTPRAEGRGEDDSYAFKTALLRMHAATMLFGLSGIFGKRSQFIKLRAEPFGYDATIADHGGRFIINGMFQQVKTGRRNVKFLVNFL